MKRPVKFFVMMTTLVMLLASLAMAQQPTAESSPMQMQSPAATSPSTPQNEQSSQPMQKMDKMADSVTKMSEMCQMMMKNEMAAAHYKMAAGVVFGVVLFLDLLLLVVLEIQWIIYWGRKSRS